MKKHNIEIIIKSKEKTADQFREDFFKDVKEGLQKIIRQKGTSKRDKIYIEDIKGLHKCISVKRLQMLQTIKKEKPESVYQLAKLTKRGFEPVKKDIKILEKNGLVSLSCQSNGRKNKIPVCNVGKITINI